MARELTKEERLLAVREFFAREDVQAKRRNYFRVVLSIGIAAAVSSAMMREFRIGGILGPVLGLAWFICMLLYTDFLTIPRTFAQDADIRWHLNPWQEVLQRLGAENRQVQGIAILTVYPVCRGVFSLAAAALGVR